MKTVHQLTVEFNELVALARERGAAPWALHHRSDFGSREVALRSLDRLTADLSEVPEVVVPSPGRMEFWTTTLRRDGKVVSHRSMARTWDGALDLALRAVRQDGIWPPDLTPSGITVERK